MASRSVNFRPKCGDLTPRRLSILCDAVSAELVESIDYDWGARLTLQEELLIARSPGVAKVPQPWRAFARLTSWATGFRRTGYRIVRYRF